MEFSDVESTDVAIQDSSASNDVMDDACPRFTGPFQQFVLLAVDRLRHAEADDELTSSLSRDLVTAYSQLDKVDRRTVDKQLVDILYALTTRGLDVNAVCNDDNRQTPLHVIASVPDSARFIRALHAAGAKINAVDRHQQTSLHIATRHANVGNVNALIDCAANVNQPDSTGQSALHLAAKGRRQVGLMRALIRGCSNPRQADSVGHTPLHVAVTAGRPELVRELIVHGRANVNERDLAGMTAIHLAAVYDVSGEVLAELLRHKSADVNARDSVAKETPVHKSVRLNMVDCTRLLLRYGANPNIRNAAGETPLHLAAVYLRDLPTWNALLDDGASNLDAKTASGVTVRDAVVKANNPIARVVIAQFDALRDAA